MGTTWEPWGCVKVGAYHVLQGCTQAGGVVREEALGHKGVGFVHDGKVGVAY